MVKRCASLCNNNDDDHNDNCVNNKIIESDWYSVALIYCLIFLTS